MDYYEVGTYGTGRTQGLANYFLWDTCDPRALYLTLPLEQVSIGLDHLAQMFAWTWVMSRKMVLQLEYA